MGDLLTPFKHGTSHKSDSTDPLPIATTSVRGTVELATDGENAADVVVQGNDARLAAVANKAPIDAQYVTLATNATLTNERVMTAGDGLVTTDGGAGGNYTVSYSETDMFKRHIRVNEEFMYQVTSAASLYITSVNGTAAAVNGGGDGTQAGFVNLLTGSTTTGRAGLMFDNTPKFIQFIFSYGEITGQTLFFLTTLSAVAQEFILRIGFIDLLTGNPVDGVWFEYDRLTSVNWRICASNNSTATKTTSSTAVVANAVTKLKIVVNSTGTSAEYFVNETSIGTVTTNIPVTAAARETSFGGSIIKSAGTTSRDFYLYYMLVDFKLNTTR